MGPVEGFFLTLAAIIVLIGLARGYQRELGNTVVFMSTILLYAVLYQYGSSYLLRIGEIFAPNSANAFLSFVLTVAFIAIVFASYAGRTFDFSGKPTPPPGGTLIDLAIGMLNGYLVAGTIWFLQAIFDYPMSRIFNWFVPNGASTAQQGTELARATIEAGQAVWWPPVLFPNAVFWAIPIVILLILRVRG